MRKVTFTCDRCGEPATEWVRMYRHDLLHGMRADAHDLQELDLCPACARELGKWSEVRSDGNPSVES